MMRKNVIVLFVFLFLVLNFVGCKKSIKSIPQVDTKLYEIGKTVNIANRMDITVTEFALTPVFKLQTSTDGIQQFPYVYLKKGKNDSRIIKIHKDGTTIDTLIDSITSKTYQSAYIVEVGGDLTKTNAKYVLDVKNNLLKPKNKDEQFVFVSINIKNISRKNISYKDLSIFIEQPDKQQIKFDPILADTILSNTNESIIQSSKILTIRNIGLLKGTLPYFILSIEGKRFKWENKEKQKTS